MHPYIIYRHIHIHMALAIQMHIISDSEGVILKTEYFKRRPLMSRVQLWQTLTVVRRVIHFNIEDRESSHFFRGFLYFQCPDQTQINEYQGAWESMSEHRAWPQGDPCVRSSSVQPEISTATPVPIPGTPPYQDQRRYVWNYVSMEGC